MFYNHRAIDPALNIIVEFALFRIRLFALINISI